MRNTYQDIITKIEEIKQNITISYDERDNQISNFIQGIESPIKEWLTIITTFTTYYSVPKYKREYLIENYSSIINSNLPNEEKEIITMALIDALYKNYEFNKAEEYTKQFNIDTLTNYIILFQLGEYYTITRRYDIALAYLTKALQISDTQEFLSIINNKIEECNKRKLGKENGGLLEYLPSTEENKIKYVDFMKTLNIEIILPTKAPEKIAKSDYPKPIELKEANFNSFVAFDLETTGIDPNKDDITELAAIRVVNGQIRETKEFIFQELIHPYKKSIPQEVEEITGITNEMVKNSRKIWEVFKDFTEWLGDDILLGYNCMSFDSKFMVRAGRLSNIIINNKYFDVMNYVRIHRNKLICQDIKLTTVSESFGIHNPQAHRALADAITTAKLYLALIEKFEHKE